MINCDMDIIYKALSEYHQGRCSLKQAGKKYGIPKKILYQHYLTTKNNKKFTKIANKNIIKIDNKKQEQNEENIMGKQIYDKAFIMQVVKELEEGVCNVPEASEVYDIPKSTLYRWRDVYIKKTKGGNIAMNNETISKENDEIINEADQMSSFETTQPTSKTGLEMSEQLKQQYIAANQQLQQTINAKETIIASLKQENQRLMNEKQHLSCQNNEELNILREENKALKVRLQALTLETPNDQSKIIAQYKKELESLKCVLKMVMRDEI